MKGCRIIVMKFFPFQPNYKLTYFTKQNPINHYDCFEGFRIKFGQDLIVSSFFFIFLTAGLDSFLSSHILDKDSSELMWRDLRLNCRS